MTATRDRQRDSQQDPSELEEWAQRSAFGTAKGWPWWAAVLLAFGLSLIGGVVDMHMSGSIGKVFEGAYFLGCVGAVCFVHRRSIFGPMVQPPLILAVAIPLSVLFSKGLPSSAGTMSKLLSLGVPLVTGFPVMAITTAATLVIGGIRFLMQRKPMVDDIDGDDRPGRGGRRPADSDRERRRDGEGRPRPSGSRPDSGRSVRDDRDSSRDSGRSRSSARSRGEAPERGSPSSSGRSSTNSSRDGDRDRGQGSRSSGQSRDRGSDRGPSRGSRPSRDDDGRRQPPRRRDDDY